MPDTVTSSLYQFIPIAFRKWALLLSSFYRWRNWGTSEGWSVEAKSCRLLQVQAGSAQILILHLLALWSWPNRGSSYLPESSFLISKIEMMTAVVAVVTKMMVTRWWWWWWSVQFSHSVMSDSLQTCGLQLARLPHPSPTPGACSNSCPSNQWWWWWYIANCQWEHFKDEMR